MLFVGCYLLLKFGKISGNIFLSCFLFGQIFQLFHLAEMLLHVSLEVRARFGG